jgi:hypothetical protein
MAAVEGIGDAEQLADLTMLHDPAVCRQVGKAVGFDAALVVAHCLLATAHASASSQPLTTQTGIQPGPDHHSPDCRTTPNAR